MGSLSLLRPATLKSLPGGRWVLGFPDGSGIVGERRAFETMAGHTLMAIEYGWAFQCLGGRITLGCVDGKIQIWTGDTLRATLGFAQARALSEQLAAVGR